MMNELCLRIYDQIINDLPGVNTSLFNKIYGVTILFLLTSSTFMYLAESSIQLKFVRFNSKMSLVVNHNCQCCWLWRFHTSNGCWKNNCLDNFSYGYCRNCNTCWNTLDLVNQLGNKIKIKGNSMKMRCPVILN